MYFVNKRISSTSAKCRLNIKLLYQLKIMNLDVSAVLGIICETVRPWMIEICDTRSEHLSGHYAESTRRRYHLCNGTNTSRPHVFGTNFVSHNHI